MSGFRIEGGGSAAGLANVSTTHLLQVGTSDDSSANGILAITGRSDDGTYTGTPLDIDPEVDQDYRLRVSQDAILFRETWAGAAINSAEWTAVLATMTAPVSAGYITLNGGGSVTASNVARIQTYLNFPLYQSFPLAVKVPFKIDAVSMGVANTGWDFGLGIVSGITATTDGIVLQMSTSGALTVSSYYNSGGANSTTAIAVPTLAVNTDYNATIVIGQRDVQMWIGDLLVATLPKPASIPTFALSSSLPFFARTYVNASGASSATKLIVGEVTVSALGMGNAPSFAEASILMGASSTQGQSGGTMGTTARAVAAGTAPGAAVPTNTTAALGSGLGGDFFHTNTLAVNTYGIISSYQCPAAALGSHNKSLHITNVRIDTTVQAVLVNAGAANYVWGIAYGHTAVSLATGEAATTKAPRIDVVGQQVAIGALVAGSQLATIDCDVDILVHPGEFIQSIVKNSGTVGGGGTLCHTIHFKGKWV